MKEIKPNPKTRSFTGLYMDSQCLSSHHERQKFGLKASEREEKLRNTQAKATFEQPVDYGTTDGGIGPE